MQIVAGTSQRLNTHGLLSIGDGQVATLDTRDSLAVQQDSSVRPRSATPMPEAAWEEDVQPVWAGQQALTPLFRERAAGRPGQIAEGDKSRSRAAYRMSATT
jgi:hypothetical protein